jgi:parallel beta-helix repeat protein
MGISRRSTLAIGVFVVLAGVVIAAKWYEDKRAAPVAAADAVAVNVTTGADRGPGSLREALFVVATATTDARITIKVQKIALETALPPLVNAHGVSIVAQTPGAEIDARELHAGPVFDVAAARTSIEGLLIRNCPASAVLLRATQFHMHATTITSCDVGVDVAENASDILLEHNRFASDRIGVRFAASSRNTSVLSNEFTADTDAGVWAVRSEPDLRGAAISVRDNRFQDDHTGIVAGNISVLVERNDVGNALEAAVHLVGAGAVIRGNRISGGAGMGIIAENARSAIIDSNELDGIAAYGILVRNSSNTLVRANRLHNCGYGMAFVLGDTRNPSTAVDNTIIEPKFNGIDVIGDNPILRRNQVMRPHALALHVEDFQPAGSGAKVRGEPLLDSNTFESATTVAVAPTTAGAPGARVATQ